MLITSIVFLLWGSCYSTTSRNKVVFSAGMTGVIFSVLCVAGLIAEEILSHVTVHVLTAPH